MECNISYIGDRNISEVHHIGIDYNGYNYSVIFGKYVNGGFCSIPNWNVSCELSDFKDKFWNSESIGKVLKDKKAGKVIAEVIATF